MKFTLPIQRAIKFSVKTHEVYQKQKRKGKDVAYITHPLTVGLILSLVGASEDVIIAGILHDTIEDSIEEKKVSKEMLVERFGQRVADLVDSVTEQERDLPWDDRKRIVLDHICELDRDSLLVKSADLISNNSELIDDYRRHGEPVFANFTAPREKMLSYYIKAIKSVLKCWPDNPLAADLTYVAKELESLD